jgi:mannose-6-phosphate isomerase-like protein (cupin superfamily)
MKRFGVGVISSLLFALVTNSRVEAFVFPNVTPDPDAPSYLFLEGVPITFLKRSETTGGRYTLAQLVLPPGTGVLPRIHHYENEWIYIEEGNPQLLIGENTYSGSNEIPGVNAPRDRIHAFNATPGTLFYAEQHRIRAGINPGTTPVKALVVWAPAGFENIFKEVSPLVPDLSNLPPFNPEILSLYASAAPKYGITASSSLEEFGDIVVDNNFPYPDNHANELLSLLGENATSVPEYSSPGAMLAFGALAAISILKRKRNEGCVAKKYKNIVLRTRIYST